MKNSFKYSIFICFVLFTSGCVSSALQTAMQKLEQDASAKSQVNKEALQVIQSLRLQQQLESKATVFSYQQYQSQLLPAEQLRFKALMLQPGKKAVLHVAPATAATSLQKILLATKRADEMLKLLSTSQRKIVIKFNPSQAVDTLLIELES